MLQPKPLGAVVQMDIAQVVGLVQARLQKRRPPQGPWAILHLDHYTRAPEAGRARPEESVDVSAASNLALEHRVAGLIPLEAFAFRLQSRNNEDGIYSIRPFWVCCV